MEIAARGRWQLRRNTDTQCVAHPLGLVEATLLVLGSSTLAHNRMLLLRGLLSAFIGGAAGYLAFQWLLGLGIYVLPLPGALLGVAAGLGKGRSMPLSVTSSVLAFLLGILTQWDYAPFSQDPGLWFFVTHLHQLPIFAMLSVVLGAFLGFWLPFHRKE